MSKANTRQEAKPQTIEANSPVLIDSAALGKKDCLHILHVDDDRCFLEVSKQILTMENNFEVEGALSVDEAFEKLEKRAYDAVVSDYEMPMKNGLQFLKELREKKNDVPFILFTGKGREEVAIQALNWGTNRYINKNGPPETVYAELAHAIVSSVEKANAERQTFYDAMLFQNVTDPILATDDKRIIKAWNNAAENLFGWTAREVTERSVQEVFDSVQMEPHEKMILEELDSRGVFHGEIVRKNKAGVPLDIELSIISLKDRLGKFIGNVAVYHDISQRKKMEDTLRQDQDMLEAITDNLGAGFVTISKDYRVLYANRFVKNNCGNVEGKQCYATLNTLDHICPDCGVKKVFEDGVAKDSHEYSQMGIDGKPYYVELIATPLKDKDGNVTAGLEFIVDIAEKKRMQQELQANEAKFRAISDSAIDGILMFDDEDRITYWNPAAERIFGYTEKEIIGQKVGATIVPPSYREDHLGLTTKLAKGENKNIEGEILESPALRKDATEFPMEFSITPLQLNGKQHFVAIARDITERKKAEEALNRAMDELVAVNEKLNVVGGLTRHDVRNKLSVITGNAFLLKKKHSDCADIIQRLDAMEQACKSIVKILDFAKMYEELGANELYFIDVEKTLDEAVVLFSASPNVKVINECHGLTVLADSFLRQLFYNLIDNSIKHGKRVTKIRVHYEKAIQDKLNLIYEDDGVGISTDNKSKLNWLWLEFDKEDNGSLRLGNSRKWRTRQRSKIHHNDPQD
jgi:PAS domain S-box-containing protein